MITIQQTLETEFRDSGAWRSYELNSFGRTLEDLIENAHISEIDQDGGEICTYGLGHAPGNVYKDAMKIIEGSNNK